MRVSHSSYADKCTTDSSLFESVFIGKVLFGLTADFDILYSWPCA